MAVISIAILLTACNTTKTTTSSEVSQLTDILNRTVVNTPSELSDAMQTAEPGDIIYLASGTWTDVELKIEGYGKEGDTITVMPVEKGKTIFEGTSNVKIGGEYLHVSGLVFKNGYTETSSVINLQIDKDTPANHCRVSECVIDDYNPSERFDTDYWIEIYGKYNRLDHCYLVGKRNRGVTLAVRMKDERDRENFHRIDHNYFGYRAILGSNGGETLRIGTSHYSLSNSNTTVEDNYFEMCNGELEIVSSKSCQNTFINNTFYECQGTLTMRHGNETIVENNYLIGNGKPSTGGIRIINEKQTVRNNYLQGLTGYRFKGALVIMNGVPNSPINRYFPVIDSDMSNNLVIDCDHIQLCAGADEERSEPPSNCTFNNNVISNTKKSKVFTVYDDISGISFNGNILSPNIAYPEYQNRPEESGFTLEDITFTESNGLKTVQSNTPVGPITDRIRPNHSNTGVRWYPRVDYSIKFAEGKRVKVAPGENTIYDAMKELNEGDVLVLQPGDYLQTKSVKVNKAIRIEGPSVGPKPTITFQRSPLFALENGGSLDLEHLNISGSESDDYSGNAVIRTSRYSMVDNYILKVRNCDIEDLDVNHSFNFLKVYKNTFADSILIQNTTFKDVSGHILNMNKEIDDTGIYNVETVEIDNCQFENIGGSAVNLYRGGRDESTFGPMIWMRDSKLVNVGYDKRNANESAIALHGVQHAELTNLTIEDSRKINLHLIVGDPVIKLNTIEMTNTEKLQSNSKAFSSENVTNK